MIIARLNLFILVWILFSLSTFVEGSVVQLDSDFDGKLDQWHHKTSDGKLEKVEYDRNGDGKPDQIDIYEGNNKPVRVDLTKPRYLVHF